MDKIAVVILELQIVPGSLWKDFQNIFPAWQE